MAVVVDVYLCPVPSDSNPADVRLRVPASGCGLVVFVPFTRRAYLAVLDSSWQADPQVFRQAVHIAGIIPPGFYLMLLDD